MKMLDVVLKIKTMKLSVFSVSSFFFVRPMKIHQLDICFDIFLPLFGTAHDTFKNDDDDAL